MRRQQIAMNCFELSQRWIEIQQEAGDEVRMAQQVADAVGTQFEEIVAAVQAKASQRCSRFYDCVRKHNLRWNTTQTPSWIFR